jgi:hypothetical protein
MPGIFINYRTGDDHYAAILVDELLSAHFGPDVVFRDSRAIPLGADFPPELWRRLRTSNAFIAVMGKAWLTIAGDDGRPKLDSPGDYVRREIKEALELGIPVIPVLVSGIALPSADQLPSDITNLASRQYKRLDPRNPGDDIRELIAELEKIAGLGPQARPDVSPARPSMGSGVIFGDDAHVSGIVAGRDVTGSAVHQPSGESCPTRPTA